MKRILLAGGIGLILLIARSLGSLAGAVASGILFILVTAVQQGGDFSRLLANPEPLLVVTVVGALASGLAALLISALARRPVVQVVQSPAPASPATEAPKPASFGGLWLWARVLEGMAP